MRASLMVIIALFLMVFTFIIAIYNTLIHLIEAICNNKNQIDIQLDRRFKVFESLIAAVKQSMDYEKTTLKEVIALRSTAEAAKVAGNETVRMAAEGEISKIVSGLHVVFEQYPALKANETVLALQEEIVSTENRLAYAKQAYNDSLERYFAKKKSFFESMIVHMFPSVLDKSFEYWGISEDKRTEKETYTVKF